MSYEIDHEYESMRKLKHRTIKTNGINMHIAEAGEGPLVILCHGFPESWYSWRHQLPVLAEAGYHVVAPDQRGYGDTDAPKALEDYTIQYFLYFISSPHSTSGGMKIFSINYGKMCSTTTHTVWVVMMNVHSTSSNPISISRPTWWCL